jgi:predicted RND superfamily exporter protein
MKNLYFNNSNEIWFLENDQALVQYQNFRDIFGNGQYMIVGVETRSKDQSIFNKDTLTLIAKITRFFEDHKLVTKTVSITNYQYIHAENDTLTTENLIENIDDRFSLNRTQRTKSSPTKNVQAESDEDIEFDDDSGFEESDLDVADSIPVKGRSYQEMLEIMQNETMVHDFLITKDMKHTIISARILYKQGTTDHHVELVNDFNTFIEQEHFKEQGFKLHISGNPLISERFQSFAIGDLMTTMPAMFLLVIIFLFLSLRTVQGVLLPMVVIVASIVTAFGILGIFNWSFNMLNITLPVLLMTVGIGDSIHLITEFYHFRNQGYSPQTAATEATKILWLPCFYTSLTTALGFLAISISNLLPLKEYGIVAAIGVAVTFLISVTTLPAMLSFIQGKPEKTERIVKQGIVAKITSQIVPFTFRYSKIIVVIGTFIILITLVLAVKITVDANLVNYFKEETQIRADIIYFDNTYNGFANLEFELDTHLEGGIKEPEFLQQALTFKNYLEELENTGKSRSIFNFIQKMNQAMHDDDPTWFKLPESRELVAQYLLLYENSGPEEDLTDLKNIDESSMRISLKLTNMSTAKMKILVREIENKLANSFPKLDVTITGDLLLFNRMDSYIQEGLIRSFSLAIGLIIICFFILLRSVKYGLLAMIPSLFPIIFAGGLMYLMEITLDFATMIVAATTFGIAVDDTIHIMTRYIDGRKNGHGRKKALHLAMTESGRALIFTSVILYFGFSILMLSSFVPNIYFGFFAGIVILVALLADLLLLPAIMFLSGDQMGTLAKASTATVDY